MRESIKSIVILFVLSIATIATATAQDAKTFYVCSNTSFTLVPQVTTFTDYEWIEIGTATPVGTAQNLTVTSPTLPGTTYATKKYTLKVKNGAGCWSEGDTFTVHVLPAISVTVAGAASSYCANNSIAVNLTTTVGSLTLPAGVTADNYEWKQGSSVVGTAASLSVNSGTSAGTTAYDLKVSYNLPTTIGGSKLGACGATGTGSVVVTAAPATPSISIQ